MSTTLAQAVTRRTGVAALWVAAWVVVGAGAAALFWVLSLDVWPKRPEMGDRFLVPIAAGVLLSMLRSRWRAMPPAPAFAGLAAVLVGAVAFPAAWYLLVQVGPRTLLLWWLSAALIVSAFGLILAGEGWHRAALVLFPLLFALFALPTPDALQSRLLPWLKGATTAGAAFVLPWLGVPATQAGYTLRLPTGQLGVVDACSGALSLTSLVAISVLTAYVRLMFRRDFSIPRAVTLVLLTLPIVVVSNTVRVIVTGLLKHYVGDEAIQGVWHEALGYSVILVGFGLIIGTSQKLARKTEQRTEDRGQRIEDRCDVGPSSVRRPLSSGILAIVLLAPAVAVCLWAEQFRQGHREVADLRAVGADLPGWQRTDLPVPTDVQEMLKCDQLLLREYEDHLGKRVQVYLMFWATPASTAHIHHPDVCWPSRGCTLAESHVRPVTYAPGRQPIGISVRHYDAGEGQREVVLYWTQNGAAVLPDGVESGDDVSEYGWVTDMLRGRQPPEQVSRLSVLLAAPVPLGRPADQEGRMEGLAGLIAADLYRVCPWAAPMD
jgi:EpsI family protein